MESEDFFHRPSSSTVSSRCSCAYHPSSLEEIYSSGVHNAPFGTEKRDLEAFQLPSLWFQLILQSVRAVLVLRHQVAKNLHVLKQLRATTPVTLLHFHNCEPSFVSPHSLFVSALTFRRLARFRQFVTSLELSEYQVMYVNQ